MGNKRLFYAIQQAAIRKDTGGNYTAIHGLQSCGMTTNFNLTQVFEYGQISIYQNVEELPDVQVNTSKVLDGYPPVYCLATLDATTPTLVGRSTSKCNFLLDIFSDTNISATGTPLQEVVCSGQFTNSVAYRFGVTDNGTEDWTGGGNNKLWANDTRIALGAPSIVYSGQFASNTDVPLAPGGVVRRNQVNFSNAVSNLDVNGRNADPDCTVLPVVIPGTTSAGLNIQDPANTAGFMVAVQSISCSVDLNRQALNELGHLGPYTRYANFPVATTCDITVISKSGDLVSANENGILSTGTACGQFLGNLSNETIRVATCEGTRVYMGLKNKLNSVSYNGGDTGGGNVNVTYSFKGFNDFTVMHSGDPNANFTWASRSGYLTN